MSAAKKLEKRVKDLQKLPQNNICFDCNRAGFQPAICLPFGIFICTYCSGLHRQFNGHQIHTISMTSWNEKQVSALEAAGGNKKAKTIWLARFEEHMCPRNANNSDQLTRFIRSTFVDQVWMAKEGSSPAAATTSTPTVTGRRDSIPSPAPSVPARRGTVTSKPREADLFDFTDMAPQAAPVVQASTARRSSLAPPSTATTTTSSGKRGYGGLHFEGAVAAESLNEVQMEAMKEVARVLASMVLKHNLSATDFYTVSQTAAALTANARAARESKHNSPIMTPTKNALSHDMGALSLVDFTSTPHFQPAPTHSLAAFTMDENTTDNPFEISEDQNNANWNAFGDDDNGDDVFSFDNQNQGQGNLFETEGMAKPQHHHHQQQQQQQQPSAFSSGFPPASSAATVENDDDDLFGNLMGGSGAADNNPFDLNSIMPMASVPAQNNTNNNNMNNNNNMSFGMPQQQQQPQQQMNMGMNNMNNNNMGQMNNNNNNMNQMNMTNRGMMPQQGMQQGMMPQQQGMQQGNMMQGMQGYNPQMGGQMGGQMNPMMYNQQMMYNNNNNMYGNNNMGMGMNPAMMQQQQMMMRQQQQQQQQQQLKQQEIEKDNHAFDDLSLPF